MVVYLHVRPVPALKTRILPFIDENIMQNSDAGRLGQKSQPT